MPYINLQKLFLRIILCAGFITHASASDSLSYSGRLVNTNGSPVTGPVDLRFDFVYTNDTATILCTQQISNIALTNGVFHTKLDPDCSPSTLTAVLAGTPASESVAVRVTKELPLPVKIYSYQALHSMPYASLAKQLPKMGAANGQFLSWNGTQWAPASEAGLGNGTVTSVATGAGLTGGPVTTTGTISIADGGVTDVKVATGISRSKLATGTANYVLINSGAGAMSEVAQLPLLLGGTGSNTAAGARTNLGLGDAAVADIGTAAGDVMGADAVPVCLGFEKLQMTAGPTYSWSCVADVDTADSTKLPLAGGTMTGAINMDSKLIINLANPTDPGDAVNKAYVDALNESQWTTNAANIHFSTGNVGVGVAAPNEKFEVAGNAALTGRLKLKSDTAFYVDLKAPAGLAGNLLLNFPGTAGTSGHALTTDGAGNLSWAAVATTASAVGGDLTGTVADAQIAAGAIVDADVAAGAAIAQSKINGLTTSLSGKEPTITAGTNLQYWRGDKVWTTLNTAGVPELTNLYFTEPRVLGTDLAGFTPATGTITDADTLLSAIEKLQGNMDAGYVTVTADFVNVTGDTMSGPLAMGTQNITGLADPTADDHAANKAYVDSQVTGISHWTKTVNDLSYSTGNVGIGIVSPDSPLSIKVKQGNPKGISLYKDDVADTAAFFKITNATSTANLFIPIFHSKSNVTTASYASGFVSDTNTDAVGEGPVVSFMARTSNGVVANRDLFDFSNNALSGTGGTTVMRIKANGNVGIGTTDPGSLLTVAGAAPEATLIPQSKNSISLFGNGSSYFQGRDVTNDIEFIMGTSTASEVFSGSISAHDYALRTGNSPRITMKHATGNVGIGTTNPASALDITSTNSGLLIPRMTTGQRDAIATPANGLQIYNTTTSQLNYYHTPTTSWKALGESGVGVQSFTVGTGLTPTGTISNTGSIAVDVGTGAGQIVQLDGSARIPAVNGSLITNLNPANLSTVVPIAKGGTGLAAAGGANTFLGVNAAGTALEYKAVSVGSPLTVTPGVGTAVIDLGTVPITKGGTGLTSLTGNHFYTANALGTAMQAFSCPLSQIITFNALGEPICSTVSAMTTYGADGGPTWSANSDGAFIKFRSTGDAAGASYLEIGTTDNSDEAITFTQTTLERMRIHTNGYVGVGTAAPSARLHVQDDANPSMKVGTSTGTLGALFLGNSSHGITRGPSGSNIGFTPNTNDVTMFTSAGSLYLANGVAGGSAVPRVTILTDGKVGIGTTNPTTPFMAGGFNNALALQSSAAGDHVYMEFYARSATPTVRSGFIGVPSAGMTDIHIGNEMGGDVVIPNGNLKAQAYLFTSDRRLKKNIKTVHNALDTVLGLRGVEFDWRKTGHHEFGFIAQEVEGIEPNLVVTGRDGIKAVKYANIVPIMVEAMREQNREIASLKEENQKLKEEIELIKKHLNIK